MSYKKILFLLLIVFAVISCKISIHQDDNKKPITINSAIKIIEIGEDITYVNLQAKLSVIEYDGKKFIIFYNGNNSCMVQVKE